MYNTPDQHISNRLRCKNVEPVTKQPRSRRLCGISRRGLSRWHGEVAARARFSLDVAISALQVTQAPPNILSHGGAGGVIAGLDALTLLGG
jgi:hypothetical protein